MKKNNLERIFLGLTIAFGLTLVAVILRASIIYGDHEHKDEDRTICPYKHLGNPDASFKIHMIDQLSCYLCHKEEPIIDRLVEEMGTSFSVDFNDLYNCEIGEKNGIKGTPSFIFEKDGKQWKRTGFIDEAEFREMLCEYADVC